MGLRFDRLFTWETHIAKISAKISQRLGIIRRIRSALPKKTAKMLVTSMILPIFDYGDIIWSNCTNKLLSKLQILHNRAGKLILNCHPHTPSCKVRQILDWYSLTERQNFHICSMVYKCYHGLAPQYLLECFTRVSNIHRYNTRFSNASSVYIQPVHNNYATRKFTYRGGNLWNSLPEHVKQAKTFKYFKTSYRDSCI